jgi:hypothetical protein
MDDKVEASDHCSSLGYCIHELNDHADTFNELALLSLIACEVNLLDAATCRSRELRIPFVQCVAPHMGSLLISQPVKECLQNSICTLALVRAWCVHWCMQK